MLTQQYRMGDLSRTLCLPLGNGKVAGCVWFTVGYKVGDVSKALGTAPSPGWLYCVVQLMTCRRQ